MPLNLVITGGPDIPFLLAVSINTIGLLSQFNRGSLAIEPLFHIGVLLSADRPFGYPIMKQSIPM